MGSPNDLWSRVINFVRLKFRPREKDTDQSLVSKLNCINQRLTYVQVYLSYTGYEEELSYDRYKQAGIKLVTYYTYLFVDPILNPNFRQNIGTNLYPSNNFVRLELKYNVV